MTASPVIVEVTAAGNAATVGPAVVLDAFIEEMDERHWSTSSDDVDAARTATLARFTGGDL